MSERLVEALERIKPVVARKIGARFGAAELLETTPHTLSAVVEDFDGVVRAYNKFSLAPFEGFHFVTRLKRFGLTRLPTVSELLDSPDGSFHRPFLLALQAMDVQMRGAETGQPEPTLAFAFWKNASHKDRLLGGIMQGYGLTLAYEDAGLQTSEPNSPGLNAWKDTVLDALIEISALEHFVGNENGLHRVSQQQGWFEATASSGAPLFSDNVRMFAAS